MIVKTASFVTSAVRPDQYPAPDRPEIAFAGRSNVGKSSLINRLVRRKRLARTSNTPGRTQLINFFDINGAFYLVDLPGYGFARVPPAVRRRWGPMVEAYLTGRATLKAVFVLVDIRRVPGPEDVQMFRYLEAAGVEGLLVVTKADKVSKGRRSAALTAVERHLPLPAGQAHLASAKTGEGMTSLWERIETAVGAVGTGTEG